MKKERNRTDLAERDGAWGAEMWGACGLWIQIQQDLLMFGVRVGQGRKRGLAGFWLE